MTKGILFNTEMVKAILDGRKTVTRRVIKGVKADWELIDLDKNPSIGVVDKWGELIPKEVNGLWATFYGDDTHVEYPMFKSPYQIGDYMYVRETWREYNGKYYYKADECPDYDDYIAKKLPCAPKWHPSIHMPKEAARIWLKVTNVRVERLQDIDGQGIAREGVDNGKSNPSMGVRWENMQRMAFEELWNSTIKKPDLDKYGWAANPWVFVVSFERIEKEKL